MRHRPNYGVLVAVLIVAVVLLSFYIHLPQTPTLFGNFGFKYTDLVYGLFNPIFVDILMPHGVDAVKAGERWFNTSSAEAFARGEYICPKPYIDYKFEYPPLVGLLWYISTCTSFRMTIRGNASYDHFKATLSNDAALMHYTIQASILTLSLLVLLIYMIKLSKVVCSEPSFVPLALFFLMPSTILYTTYNWDIIASAFTVAGLYYYITGSFAASGTLLGLAIATKIIPVGPALVLTYQLIQNVLRGRNKWTDLVRFTLLLSLCGGAPFLALMLMSPRGFASLVNHHLEWYCENCIYLPFIGNVWGLSALHKRLIFVAMMIVLGFVATFELDDSRKTLYASAAAILTLTVLNHVFSPQMFLLVSPIVMLLGLRGRLLYAFIIADVCNFGIMATFFEDAKIREVLAPFVGVQRGFNPWGADSVTQMLAFIRNVILLVLLVELIQALRSSSTRVADVG